MPFRWMRGNNPYVDNAFGVLQIGSLAAPSFIAARAENRAKSVRPAARGDGSTPDAHAIAQAAKTLNSPATRAEEQLLVHPQMRQDTERRKRLIRQIQEAAALDPERNLPALRDPLALFWFTPLPTAEAAPLPPWEALHLTAVGDPDDLALDIVFDA